MRFDRLDLLRYGHFSDRSISFPAPEPGGPDIHVVYGPNEAGKSTALSAIEDVLFGIPAKTSLAFLHGYAEMRIGAVLTHADGGSLEIRRRKGNKDTLLDPDGTPIRGGEAALAPFLGDADRAFLERMFSLDHERLRQGGRDILKPEDSIGQTLFSAGAGLSGLGDIMKALDQEADNQWAPRPAGHRAYYQAEKVLKDADVRMREHMVTASRYRSLSRERDEAEAAYDALVGDMEARRAELARFSRIMRLAATVRHKQDAEAELARLGEVPPLPANAAERLEQAVQAERTAAAKIEQTREDLERATAALHSVVVDGTVLDRASEIEALNEHRVRVRGGRAELPQLQADLALARRRFAALAGEMGWPEDNPDDVMDRLPARSAVSAVRALATAYQERKSALQSAEAAVAEARQRLADQKRKMEALGPPVDTRPLSAAVEAARTLGDMAGRIEAAERMASDAASAVERLLATLSPAMMDEADLAAISPPARDTVADLRDRFRDLDARRQAARDRLGMAEVERDQRIAARDRLVRDRSVVSRDDLMNARARRDRGWSLIRRLWADGESVPPEDIEAFVRDCGMGAEAGSTGPAGLAAGFEAASAQADTMADRRFEHSSKAAHHALLTEQIAEQEDAVKAARAGLDALDLDHAALTARWEAAWQSLPFQPGEPDGMLVWLDTRAQCLEGIERRDATWREVERLKARAEAVRRTILEALETIEPDVRLGGSLAVVIEGAAAIVSRYEQAAQSRRDLAEAMEEAEAELARKVEALDRTTAEWNAWLRDWQAALAGLGLDANLPVRAITDQIDAIEDMRGLRDQIRDLRDGRIDRIERDIARFEADVAALAGAVAPDLTDPGADEACEALSSRLSHALKADQQRAAHGADIDEKTKRLDALERERRQAADAIAALGEEAGIADTATDPEQLRAIIATADRVRAIREDHAKLMDYLRQGGDGLSVEEIEAECNDIDADTASARAETVRVDIDELTGRLNEAHTRLVTARAAFEAVGGDDAAARAAADRQAALDRMEQAAAAYARARAARVLLGWAIDRYRRDKQAPLLTRAGVLFATLTEGAFETLTVTYDDQDRPHIAGVRGGEPVALEGMSTGTGDQLYLALRLAAVEDYLTRARSLPFVADDLFIHFDDGRASAGLAALSELARKTQVIVFTHHAHLVDLARATLGASVSIQTIRPGGPEPAASR